MMTYKNLILLFFEKKANLLLKKYGIKKASFFNSKDIQSIKRLEESSCRLAYLCMKDTVENTCIDGLAFHNNPFCIFHRNARGICDEKCEYGTNHEQIKNASCHNTFSDFTDIKSIVKKNDIKITNQDYKQLIYEIEQFLIKGIFTSL